MHLAHWIGLALIIGLVTRGILRLANPFWSRQPVFHPYRLDMWVRQCGIIDKSVPQPDGHVSPSTQKTVLVGDLSKSDREAIVALLADHYLPREQGTFVPSWHHTSCGMAGSPYSSSFTLGTDPEGDMVSVISARPLEVRIKDAAPFWVYYVDNLCIKKSARGKGLAPKAIRTLYHDVRHRESAIEACLFKREGQSMGIVPITSYKVHAYQSGAFDSWTSRVDRASGGEGARDCWEAVRDWSSVCQVSIITSCAAFMTSVEKESLYVFSSAEGGGVRCIAVFRDPACDYGDGKAIELCAYIEDPAWPGGGAPKLLSACRQACADLGAGTVIIDELGKETGPAVALLGSRGMSPVFTSATSLFFYNYVHRPRYPRDCIMLF